MWSPAARTVWLVTADPGARVCPLCKRRASGASGVACHVSRLEVAGAGAGHDRAPVVSEGKARQTSPAFIRSGIS